MKTILLTGFEPFGGESINPSWDVVKRLEGARLHTADQEFRIVSCCLPCVFGASLTTLFEQIEALQPCAVLATGQAGGRSAISLERVAINIDDARIADNQAQQPIDQPIVPQGPAAYFSTLPIKAATKALLDQGIPAFVSNTAGTYVCNHVMYGLLHHLRNNSEVKGGFIHVQYLPSQVISQVAQPSMSAELMSEALLTIARVTVETDQDIKLIAGATH